jgi:hypothetical protein
MSVVVSYIIGRGPITRIVLNTLKSGTL